eukprot:scaffold74617_cov34-Tisochrysis_lutea.AAC.2
MELPSLRCQACSSTAGSRLTPMATHTSSSPVRGYPPCSCVEQYLTRGSSAMMAATPLPWCTSQSSTATRPSGCEARYSAAATAAKLMRQKPIGVSRVAWCPGGRASASAGPAPLEASDTASSHVFVPSIIAFQEPGAQ